MTTFEDFSLKLLIALLNSSAWTTLVTLLAGPLHSAVAFACVAGATALCLLVFAILASSEA